MGDVILAGVLTWLLACTWFAMELAIPFRTGRREKVVGVVLLALGLIPVAIALWQGT